MSISEAGAIYREIEKKNSEKEIWAHFTSNSDPLAFTELYETGVKCFQALLILPMPFNNPSSSF